MEDENVLTQNEPDENEQSEEEAGIGNESGDADSIPADSKTPAEENSKRAKRTPRGAVPPALSVSEAARLAIDIYEKTGGSVRRSNSQDIFGNSPSSSTFQRKITTMKNYGLVTEENDVLTLSPLGEIVAAPKDEVGYLEDLRKVFLKVEVFSKLYERFRGRPLPQPQFLINIFREYVPHDLANIWIKKFIESAKDIRLLKETDGKFLVLESQAVPQEEKVEEKIEEKVEPAEQKIAPPIEPKREDYHANLNRLPIPLGQGRLAYIELPDRWEAKELPKLLKILKLALSEEVVVDDEK